jgi:hypothetical protein
MHAALLLALQSVTTMPIDLVEVAVPTRAEVARLHALARDVDDHDRADDGWIRVHADAREQRELAQAGFVVRVVTRDLARSA